MTKERHHHHLISRDHNKEGGSHAFHSSTHGAPDDDEDDMDGSFFWKLFKLGQFGGGLMAPGSGKHRMYFDDDFVDRMNYQFSALLFIVFIGLIGLRQYVGKPIQCFIPQEFTRGWEEYAENYCWVASTYFAPIKDRLPHREDRSKTLLGYYQWAPIMLALQSIIFYMPCLIWRALQTRSGFHLNRLMQMAFDANISLLNQGGGAFADMFDHYHHHYQQQQQQQYRSSNPTHHPKHSIASSGGAGGSGAGSHRLPPPVIPTSHSFYAGGFVPVCPVSGDKNIRFLARFIDQSICRMHQQQRRKMLSRQFQHQYQTGQHHHHHQLTHHHLHHHHLSSAQQHHARLFHWRSGGGVPRSHQQQNYFKANLLSVSATAGDVSANKIGRSIINNNNNNNNSGSNNNNNDNNNNNNNSFVALSSSSKKHNYAFNWLCSSVAKLMCCVKPKKSKKLLQDFTSELTSCHGKGRRDHRLIGGGGGAAKLNNGSQKSTQPQEGSGSDREQGGPTWTTKNCCFGTRRSSSTAALAGNLEGSGSKLIGGGGGMYLTCLYFAIKVLYLVNLVGQLYLMEKFVGAENAFYGLYILMDLLNGRDWYHTGNFPRVTFCDFETKKVGKNEIYTLQCVLPMNMFLEKIYIFLWFWHAILIILTLISLAQWLYRMGLAKHRVKFVRQYLHLMRAIEHTDRTASRSFVEHYLQMDGVFLLRMIYINIGDLITGDLFSSFGTFIDISVVRSVNVIIITIIIINNIHNNSQCPQSHHQWMIRKIASQLSKKRVNNF